MSADDTALLNEIERLIASGHTFQFGPSGGNIFANVSGPSGSRSATAPDLRHAMGSLIIQIVSARLDSPSGSAPEAWTPADRNRNNRR
jgi:hypothetical protein